MRSVAWAAAAVALAGCNRAPTQQPSSNAAEPVNAVSEAPPIPPPATGPNARTPLAEPKGTIDPKSVEAAGQVVQHYSALIEQGRWTESWKLWSNADAARRFDRNWRNDSEVHMEIGKPGDTDGAAGSIYLTMPVIFYGKDRNHTEFRRAADVVLRRVNDVPGSTEMQRRWHIERIDWSNPV